MLDRSKVAKELHIVADKLFFDSSAAFAKAQQVWEKIIKDPVFIYKVRHANVPWLLPTWDGELGAISAIQKAPDEYQILAVDGSQIYPDKHQGTSCFLVNIGTVELTYAAKGGRVQLGSVPYVFPESEHDELSISTDLVNCKRQELEFLAGYTKAMQLKHNQLPLLFLFDGSLVFWHLESKDEQIKNVFLPIYLEVLENLYKAQVPLAGYISLPKSKELINLVRLELCKGVVQEDAPKTEVDSMVDGHLMSLFLSPFTRTTVFENHSKITQQYPPHLKPYFFYMHVGTEVARIEIPAWIAQQEAAVNTIATLIVDQCNKGRGYPVGLAEAHEQAVVKGPDRDFFYHLIQKLGIEHKQKLAWSQKVIKKRGLGI